MSALRGLLYPDWLPKDTLGQHIVKLRKERGWNLNALAEHSGIHYSALSMVEHGNRGLTLGNLNRLARSFGLTPAEFLTGVDLSEWERAE